MNADPFLQWVDGLIVIGFALCAGLFVGLTINAFGVVLGVGGPLAFAVVPWIVGRCLSRF